jgi:ethylbenzene hydroxylase subunit gamma/complex iron-sulfur molybdoenzyme family reductase subunit gamma
MQVRYVPRFEIDAVLQPDAAVWRGVKTESVKLKGTPLDMQPTAAIKASWADKKIGAVEVVQVAAVHDGERIAFRLEWSDANEDLEITDTMIFPDGCGILLPAVQFAPMAVMGAVGMAVNAWYWRADENGRGRHVLAEGLGTTRTLDYELVRGNGVYKDGRWQVVITRALKVQSAENPAQLEPGQSTGFAVAIWEGGQSERAGLKAISGDDWIKLDLEPTTSA